MRTVSCVGERSHIFQTPSVGQRFRAGQGKAVMHTLPECNGHGICNSPNWYSEKTLTTNCQFLGHSPISASDLPINDTSSRTLCRFAFGPRLVCEKCTRPEGFLREFRRAMASRAAIFPTDHLLSGPPPFGTFSAHRPGHDIAKHAIRRHRLADAELAYRRMNTFQANNHWRKVSTMAFGTDKKPARELSDGLKSTCKRTAWDQRHSAWEAAY